MKIRIAKNVFVNGLQQVLNVVGTRTSLPILSNYISYDEAIKHTQSPDKLPKKTFFSLP